MSKMNPSFETEIEKEINQAVEKATIYNETNTVKFEPNYSDDVTAESLQKHTDWLNRQAAVVEAGTMNVAIENFSPDGTNIWNGSMDLGSNIITSTATLSEQVGDNTSYGVTDTLVDSIRNEELETWYDSFDKANAIRCKALFDTE